MFVKICGITNRDDAFAAIDAGAGALGFIFYPKSPRCVRAETVAAWIGEIPPRVWRVGVFVNEHPAAIEAIGAQLNLDVAQLHGNEVPLQHPRGLRVWKAFRVTGDSLEQPDYPAEALLLDGPASGKTFPWQAAREAHRPVVLAGGLTPANVRAAIRKTAPWGVDTASGVEISPGRKDHEKMKSFIQAALHA